MLYLSDMTMLWWRHKESEIGKGSFIIYTWEKFQEDFKKVFFPNNVVYEAKRKFRKLKQKDSMHECVQEFITLTLQIPNLTYEDMLFHFMDGWKNGPGWSWKDDMSGLLMKSSSRPNLDRVNE